MTFKKLTAACLLSSFVVSSVYGQSLTDSNILRSESSRRPKYNLFDDSNFDNDVGEYRAGYFPGAILMPVHVWGSTKTTGLFRVPKNTSLTTFLSYARGPTDNARIDNVKIKRVSEAREKVFTVNLEKVIEDPQVNDPVLMPNDIIYIESKKPLIHPDVAGTVALISGIMGIVLASIVLSRETK